MSMAAKTRLARVGVDGLVDHVPPGRVGEAILALAGDGRVRLLDAVGWAAQTALRMAKVLQKLGRTRLLAGDRRRSAGKL